MQIVKEARKNEGQLFERPLGTALCGLLGAGARSGAGRGVEAPRGVLTDARAGVLCGTSAAGWGVCAGGPRLAPHTDGTGARDAAPAAQGQVAVPAVTEAARVQGVRALFAVAFQGAASCPPRPRGPPRLPRSSSGQNLRALTRPSPRAGCCAPMAGQALRRRCIDRPARPARVPVPRALLSPAAARTRPPGGRPHCHTALADARAHPGHLSRRAGTEGTNGVWRQGH